MTSFVDQVGVMIAIPLSGAKLVPEFTWSFMSLNPGMNYQVRYCQIKHTEVGVARNWLAEQAIAQNCKYIFFVDEDVTMPAFTLRQLLMRCENNPNIAVIGGIYCHKQYPPQPMIFRGNGNGPYWDWKVGECFEVSGIGMGCTLIRTEIFNKLEKPWFKTVDDGSQFLDGRNELIQYTEDLWFLDKVREAKLEIWADGSILCEHWDTNTLQPVVLPTWTLPYRRKAVEKGKKKILDIGAGESPYQTDEGETVTVDAREEVNPDYRADVRMLPFANDEFDIVWHSHCLEHFGRDEWKDTLKEWVRVLKPEGEMRCVVPNIMWAAEQLIKEKNSEFNKVHAWNVLYGAETYSLNFHKMGFIPEILQETLKEFGFKRIEVMLEGYNICIRAWRIPPDKIEPVRIYEGLMFPKETIIVKKKTKVKAAKPKRKLVNK